jgi:hypothetical protein
LSGVAQALFDICNASPWAVLERGKLVFDFPSGGVLFQAELSNTLGEGTLVVVPLRMVVAELRDQLLAVRESDAQQMLRFPPTGLPTPPKRTALRG